MWILRDAGGCCPKARHRLSCRFSTRVFKSQCRRSRLSLSDDVDPSRRRWLLPKARHRLSCRFSTRVFNSQCRRSRLSLPWLPKVRRRVSHDWSCCCWWCCCCCAVLYPCFGEVLHCRLVLHRPGPGGHREHQQHQHLGLRHRQQHVQHSRQPHPPALTSVGVQHRRHRRDSPPQSVLPSGASPIPLTLYCLQRGVETRRRHPVTTAAEFVGAILSFTSTSDHQRRLQRHQRQH